MDACGSGSTAAGRRGEAGGRGYNRLMSQPQLDYALPGRRRSRFMSAALLFVRIHAALGLCFSVGTFWLYVLVLLREAFVDGSWRIGDLGDTARTLGQVGYIAVTPLALSAMLFLGCEIYARRDAADAAVR